MILIIELNEMFEIKTLKYKFIAKWRKESETFYI